jgi:hypothetical protein
MIGALHNKYSPLSLQCKDTKVLQIYNMENMFDKLKKAIEQRNVINIIKIGGASIEGQQPYAVMDGFIIPDGPNGARAWVEMDIKPATELEIHPRAIYLYEIEDIEITEKEFEENDSSNEYVASEIKKVVEQRKEKIQKTSLATLESIMKTLGEFLEANQVDYS